MRSISRSPEGVQLSSWKGEKSIRLENFSISVRVSPVLTLAMRSARSPLDVVRPFEKCESFVIRAEFEGLYVGGPR